MNKTQGPEKHDKLCLHTRRACRVFYSIEKKRRIKNTARLGMPFCWAWREVNTLLPALVAYFIG